MVEQYFSHFVDLIFVVAACTAVKVVKVGKVVSFVGKIFVVRASTTNNLFPENTSYNYAVIVTVLIIIRTNAK